MSQTENLLIDLLNIGVFKLGQFTLKSGVSSPIYIDLRTIIAFPNLVGKIAEEVRRKQIEQNIEMDVVCGVPYTALPIASVFSVQNSVPMIMKRKEAKSYGTKKIVEGVFSKNTKCLIVEDIVSSGSSIIETADALRKEGLVVTDCIAILNRMQGGVENLTENGITLHALFNIHQLFKEYCSLNVVEPSLIETVQNYLENNYIPIKKSSPTISQPFNQRSKLCKQPVLRNLFNIMFEKKTNLCVSVDVTQSKELLSLAEKVGPHICILKTHIDILQDFSKEVVNSLQFLAHSLNFLIMEDRKFGDIGNTVINQYRGGIYCIEEWADIVTVHGIPGVTQVEALKLAARSKERACVLVAEMSSKGALTDEIYQSKIVEIVKSCPEFAIGFITQHKLVENEDIIHMTPGVNLGSKGDCLGQQYNSPETAVMNGADVIIVGRGICNSCDVVETAIQYKTEGYNAYLKKLKL